MKPKLIPVIVVIKVVDPNGAVPSEKIDEDRRTVLDRVCVEYGEPTHAENSIMKEARAVDFCFGTLYYLAMEAPLVLGNYVLILMGIVLTVSGPVIVFRTWKGYKENQTKLGSALINVLIAVLFTMAGVLFVKNNTHGNPLFQPAPFTKQQS